MASELKPGDPLSTPVFHCNVCGYDWRPMGDIVPLRCSRCKSPYWHRPATDQAAGKPSARVARKSKQTQKKG